ncbi:hypothetical protein D9758_017641 [Tetrapyrgos nigripes]|uniref:Uncharacterized protein n=1 Tax=Tetrapyrgos nigripes TaxID=182062 RepID=A0A8H5CG10_9AGAR|nr:hypothetical protein D9758_017641 [Tetrapyrgos nigripes]
MSAVSSLAPSKEHLADLPTFNRPQSDRTLTADSEKALTPNSSVELLTFPDGGFRAWRVALGCFMLSSSCLGYVMVWGVLQDYYHTTMFPTTSLTVLTSIAGLSSFVLNGGSYFFGVLGDRYGYKVVSYSIVVRYPQN